MADFVKIDKGIPIPPDPRGRPRVYPWHEMQIGDSFVLERLNTNAPKRLLKQGWGFTKRTMADGSARVWRFK